MNDWIHIAGLVLGLLIVYVFGAFALGRIVLALLRRLRPQMVLPKGRAATGWGAALLAVLLLAAWPVTLLLWPVYLDLRVAAICPDLAKVEVRVAEPHAAGGVRIEADTPGLVAVVAALTSGESAWSFVEIGPDRQGRVVRADARWAREAQASGRLPGGESVPSEATVQFVREVEKRAASGSRFALPRITGWTHYRLQVVSNGYLLATYSEPALQFFDEVRWCHPPAGDGPPGSGEKILQMLRAGVRPG